MAEESIRLATAAGLQVDLVGHGAAIQAIRVPTRVGVVNVALGYANAGDYRNNPYYLGATIGRYAGRIRDGSCMLCEQRLQLATDPDLGPHCLHGGPGGLHSRRWECRQEPDATAVVFTTRSEAGDQGFPGAVELAVRYSLSDTALAIELGASSDADTILNLSNHCYFNLAGRGLIDGHEVLVNADAYTPLDDTSIPTGEILPVRGTPFDLREPLRLRVGGSDQHTIFDHNFVLNRADSRHRIVNELTGAFAASVTCPESGLRLDVYTSQPGLQFYTGQFLGEPFVPYSGLCLEAQRFPDAPNQPAFPSALLRAGDTYREVIVYEFTNLPAGSVD